MTTSAADLVEMVVCCVTQCSMEVPKSEAVPNGLARDGSIRSFKCKPCNKARYRCERVLREHPSIEAMASEAADKNSISAKCHELFGQDLVAKLRREYTVSTTATASITMEGTGEFLDEDDLKQKYEHKPQKLEAIKKNTKRFYDEVGEVQLFEDMTYKSIRTDTVSASRTVTATVDEKEEKIKPKAKAKKEAKEEPNKDSNDKAQPLTDKQVERLRKLLEGLTKTYDTLIQAEEPLGNPDNAWVQFVPEFVKAKVALVKSKRDVIISGCQCAVEQTDLKDLVAKIAETNKEMKDITRRLLLQIDDAKSLE